MKPRRGGFSLGRDCTGAIMPAVKSPEFLNVPRGHHVVDIMAAAESVVTLWESPDGTDPVYTFEGEIRDFIARYAERHHLTFEETARKLADGARNRFR
jgi:hypothetical protein